MFIILSLLPLLMNGKIAYYCVVSEELLEFLDVLPWTGNTREVENLMERLVTLAPKEMKILDNIDEIHDE